MANDQTTYKIYMASRLSVQLGKVFFISINLPTLQCLLSVFSIYLRFPQRYRNTTEHLLLFAANFIYY